METTKKKVVFETFEYADVSTAHITESDGKLIGRQDAPGHIASLDPLEEGYGSPGDIFHVLIDDPGCAEDRDNEMLEFGFSAAFVDIFHHLREQKIPYVRFDADGADVEGLPQFDW